MEGVTDHIWRKLHNAYFGGVDRYYLPFISPTQDHRFTAKELCGLSPENNGGLSVIPQFLTKNAEDFLWAAHAAGEMGYTEVNLNLGCPSGTVVAKGKGAGMLADPVALDRFLDQIYTDVKLSVSVKTRIGIRDPAEFERILAVYQKYPIRELILHPRTQKELYRGEVHMELFELANTTCPFPVTYNGNLRTAEQVLKFSEQYPSVGRVMIGRGLAADPMLAKKIAGTFPDADLCRSTFCAFYASLSGAYCEAFASERNAMMRMKELWNYFICMFEDTDAKYHKRIRKVRTYAELSDAAQAVFDDLPMRSSLPDNL